MTNDTRLKRFLTLLVDRLQDCENNFIVLLRDLSLEFAYGETLDILGSIVGRAREIGQSDADYRVSIQGKILENQGSGTPEELINAVKTYMDEVAFIRMQEGTAAVYLMTDGEFPGSWYEVLLRLQSLCPAGVHLYLISLQDITPFSFEYDGATPTDALGFDELNYYPGGQHLGGRFTELYTV